MVYFLSFFYFFGHLVTVAKVLLSVNKVFWVSERRKSCDSVDSKSSTLEFHDKCFTEYEIMRVFSEKYSSECQQLENVFMHVCVRSVMSDSSQSHGL